MRLLARFACRARWAVLFLLPFLLAADNLDKSPFLEEIDGTTQLPDTGEFVYIFSPGGSVNAAFRLQEQVKDKTCIVFAAASAALMIILPSCKERYYVQGAVLGFHSAGIYAPSDMFITQWDAAELAHLLAQTNLRIMQHIVLSGAPWSPEFLETAMKTDAYFAGEQLGQWGEWLRPVQLCTHCPQWTKVVTLKLR